MSVQLGCAVLCEKLNSAKGTSRSSPPLCRELLTELLMNGKKNGAALLLSGLD
jgi:hypothetical protein